MSVPRPIVTIRKSTADERRRRYPAIVKGGRRVRVPKYLCVNPQTNSVWTVFGLPQGGDTRPEAVFWAERLASKNDLVYVAPDGWANVRGKLKERE